LKETSIIESKRLAFSKSETIKIEFLNQTITGKFIKWEGDRPFDIFPRFDVFIVSFTVIIGIGFISWQAKRKLKK